MKAQEKWGANIDWTGGRQLGDTPRDLGRATLPREQCHTDKPLLEHHLDLRDGRGLQNHKDRDTTTHDTQIRKHWQRHQHPQAGVVRERDIRDTGETGDMVMHSNISNIRPANRHTSQNTDSLANKKTISSYLRAPEVKRDAVQTIIWSQLERRREAMRMAETGRHAVCVVAPEQKPAAEHDPDDLEDRCSSGHDDDGSTASEDENEHTLD